MHYSPHIYVIIESFLRLLGQNNLSTLAIAFCFFSTALFFPFLEANQQLLIERPSSGRYIVHLLASGNAAVQTECLALLQLYIHTQHGRHLTIAHLNLHK